MASRKPNLLNGLVAGLVASVIVGLVMLAERALGLANLTDPVAVVAGVLGYTSESGRNLPLAWAIHFLVGTLLWGLAYALIEPRLTGRPAARGLIFGVLAWLVMMLLVMPLTGTGLFGFGYGLGVPLSLLILHLIFGAALGVTYARLRGGAAREDVLPL